MKRSSFWPLVLLTTIATPSFAQVTNPAAATSLFEEGRVAANKGDLVTACAKFAESERLDPKVGTLLNLAQCEEKLGRLLSARQHWLEAIALATTAKDDRLAVAQQRLAALQPLIPRITVKVSGTASAVVVQRDGELFPADLIGLPQLIDPGDHRFEISAEGRGTTTTKVTIAQGDRLEVVLTVAPAKADAPTAPPVIAGPVVPASTPPSTPPRDAGGLPSQKVFALAIGAAGVVAVGVGVGFGLHALSRYDDSEPFCDDRDGCDDEGLGIRKDARRAATWSTVGFAVGLGALAGATVLWLTAPKANAPSAKIAIGPSGFVLEGRW
jgi:hypothetical protein